jgi:hypothetical protein
MVVFSMLVDLPLNKLEVLLNLFYRFEQRSDYESVCRSREGVQDLPALSLALQGGL